LRREAGQATCGDLAQPIVSVQQHGDQRFATAWVLNQRQQRHHASAHPIVVALESFDQVLDRAGTDDRQPRLCRIDASLAAASQLANEQWYLV
jgi:hypothetical protein